MSKEFLFSLYELVKKKRIINDEIIQKIEEIFPNGSKNVIETIQRGITKYIYKPSNRVVWTALGKENEYLIYPKLYCICKFFYMKVVIDREKDFCKHILAQLISEALGNYKIIELEDHEFEKRIHDLNSNF